MKAQKHPDHILIPWLTHTTPFRGTRTGTLIPGFSSQLFHLKTINSSDTCTSKHLQAASTGGLCWTGKTHLTAWSQGRTHSLQAGEETWHEPSLSQRNKHKVLIQAHRATLQSHMLFSNRHTYTEVTASAEFMNSWVCKNILLSPQ